MPPLQTPAQVELAVANIVRRGAAIGRPFAFETGVNYFATRPYEMPDGEFFADIALQADCGILLDLNNLWCNQQNGRASIADVVAALPLDRVWEVHLAGAEFAHGHWLDAHTGVIDSALVDIAAEVIPALPNLGAILFEISSDRLSTFSSDEYLREIETLHRLWSLPRAQSQSRFTATIHASIPPPSGLTPHAWETLLAIRMLPVALHPAHPSDLSPLTPLSSSDDRSFQLYSTLVAAFRNSAIHDLMPHTIRLLLLALGESDLRALLSRYAKTVPPAVFPTDEALTFTAFLHESLLRVPALDDILAFESAAVLVAADSRTIRITLRRDLPTLLGDLAAHRLPNAASERPPFTLELGVDDGPFVHQISTALT